MWYLMVKLDETLVADSRGERWGDWGNKVVCGSVLHLLISVELVCVNSGMRHNAAFIPGVSSQVSTRVGDASWFAEPTRCELNLCVSRPVADRCLISSGCCRKPPYPGRLLVPVLTGHCALWGKLP
jgi:hypothetical protein